MKRGDGFLADITSSLLHHVPSSSARMLKIIVFASNRALVNRYLGLKTLLDDSVAFNQNNQFLQLFCGV
jgi:hypothetical protein